MSGAGGARLVVHADLTVRVTDPRGRSAAVVVDDHDGAVRVRVAQAADLAVLLGSLPRSQVANRADVASLVRTVSEQVGARWDQDVEVLLGSRLLLRRRGGRWRPTTTTVVPVALATVSTVTVLGVVVSLVVRLVRLVGRTARGDRRG